MSGIFPHEMNSHKSSQAFVTPESCRGAIGIHKNILILLLANVTVGSTEHALS